MNSGSRYLCLLPICPFPSLFYSLLMLDCLFHIFNYSLVITLKFISFDHNYLTDPKLWINADSIILITGWLIAVGECRKTQTLFMPLQTHTSFLNWAFSTPYSASCLSLDYEIQVLFTCSSKLWLFLISPSILLPS